MRAGGATKLYSLWQTLQVPDVCLVPKCISFFMGVFKKIRDGLPTISLLSVRRGTLPMPSTMPGTMPGTMPSAVPSAVLHWANWPNRGQPDGTHLLVPGRDQCSEPDRVGSHHNHPSDRSFCSDGW